MSEAGFDLFITRMFDLYNGLIKDIRSNRQYVIGAADRALAIMKNYTPSDDSEVINLEVAIEMFEELRQKTAGTI